MPPVHIKIAGAWKEVDKVHIKVGGVWKEVDQASIRVGGAWKETLSTAPVPVVSLNTANVTYSTSIGTCYANLQYNTSGVEYKNSSGSANNFSTSRGNWLDSGAAANAWLERTINSGSLYTDPGAGRLNMATTRSFRVRDTNAGSGGVSCNLDIEMWDAASGGSLLDSVAGLVLSATYFNPCPTCCFTPDTEITMGDGSTKPICDIEEGDSIRTFDGVEQVAVVITREDRPMWRVEVEDGRTLILSEDHPVYVDGKGYSCINPEQPYKDLVTTDKIEEGDSLMLESGTLLRIVKLERYHYPSTVYTLGNSRFYANGILVY